MVGLLSRPRAGRRIAVCDLGSNSFRLVVFEASGSFWRRTDEIYEAVRIGTGLAASGRLTEDSIERALATIEVFAQFCQASEIEQVHAVATSAIRDASNADELIRRSALPIRVLSPTEEARYGYVAAINSTALTDGCVLDLGGGSMQLISVGERIERRGASWPVGAVRMTERFELGDEAPSKKQLRALREHIEGELAGTDWIADTGSHLVGIGGTLRNLATAAQRAASFPDFGVQGFRLSRAALGELIERFSELSGAQRGAVSGIKPARGDLILAGAIVIDETMRIGGFEEIEVTEAGLREGVFFSEFIDGDPPLFPDVRRMSVSNLAALYPVDPPGHVDHVSRLALELFDGLAEAGLHSGDPVERELLWAACQLHDIGMAIAYDDHHRHSRYLILNAGLPGFSPREVALIAQAVRYHRKGTPEAGEFAALFDKADRQRLTRMATLLRLAEDLERSRDGSVRRARLNVDNGAVQLALVADHDTRVPRWAASRETELFKRAFDRDLEIA